jgi:hypothetical protein
MGRGITEGCVEPQHIRLQSNKLHTFRQLYGEEPVRPEDIKFRSTRTRPEAVYSPTKAKPKDLIELERIKADENQHAYQSEMRVWKDKKGKE